MEYRDAIIRLHDQYGLSILTNRFLTRSILSDYVGTSPYDYRLINILFDISSSIDIVKIFNDNGLKKGREELNGIYKELKLPCSGKEFVDAINPISSILCPDEYQEYLKNRKNNKKVQGVVVMRKKDKPQKKNTLIHQVIQTNNPANPAPIKKKNSPIKNVVITTNSPALNVYKAKGKTAKVLINGQDRKVDFSKYKVGNTLKLPFNTPYKRVDVYLPKATYDSITIVGGTTNVVLYDDVKYKKASINVNVGGILTLAPIDEVLAKADMGVISILNGFKEGKLTVGKGSAEFFISTSMYKNVNITASVNNGSIKGFVREASFQPKIRKVFGRKPKKVNETRMVNGCQINFDLYVNHGTIKVS